MSSFMFNNRGHPGKWVPIYKKTSIDRGIEQIHAEIKRIVLSHLEIVLSPRSK